jgi:hypothetical protein
MKRLLLALLLVAPAFSVIVPHQDPIPKCFPCPPTPPPAW